MTTEIEEKTTRYEELLATALEESMIAVPAGTPLFDAARDHREMARSYLEDGRHFRSKDDQVNALAAFSYGHAWLDSGARIGLFDVPMEGNLFTVHPD